MQQRTQQSRPFTKRQNKSIPQARTTWNPAKKVVQDTPWTHGKTQDFSETFNTPAWPDANRQELVIGYI